MKIVLTIAEIKSLAQFCGLVLTNESILDQDQDDTEIAIDDCPESGLIDTDKLMVCRYAHIAYFEELPEEGCMGLGIKL